MAFRLLNRNGKFNIIRHSRKKILMTDLYHSFLSLDWITFTAISALIYLGANFLFGLMYYACGPDGFNGVMFTTAENFFWDCFFFSVHTLSTIGYGTMAPKEFIPNLLVTGESFFGLFGLAIIAGLLFAKFSRPTARVVFSHNAIVTKHNGQPCLMFRMANARLNQIAEARVTVILLQDTTSKEGTHYRTFHPLKLERESTPAFALSWTVVHIIDENSPLHNLTHLDLEKTEAEVFVSLIGIDETYSQTISARHSYVPEEILWNRRFKDITTRIEGKVKINLDDIHHTKQEV